MISRLLVKCVLVAAVGAGFALRADENEAAEKAFSDHRFPKTNLNETLTDYLTAEWTALEARLAKLPKAERTLRVRAIGRLLILARDEKNEKRTDNSRDERTALVHAVAVRYGTLLTADELTASEKKLAESVLGNELRTTTHTLLIIQAHELSRQAAQKDAGEYEKDQAAKLWDIFDKGVKTGKWK